MLPHYSPLKVAEAFSILGGLHRRPHRPRHRPRARHRPQTMFALQRDRRQLRPTTSRAARRAARATSRTTSRPTTRSRGSRRCPGAPGQPDVWLLGSSPAKRDLGRASSACRTRSPISSTPKAPRSRASTASASSRRERREQPELAVCVSAICADTDEEAQRLASSQRMAITLLRRGRLDRRSPGRDGARASSRRKATAAAAAGRRVVVGTPETVRAGARGGRRRVRRRRADARDDHVRPRRAAPLVRADRRRRSGWAPRQSRPAGRRPRPDS